MPNLTARQMLSRVPVRMAEGGQAQAFSDDEVKQFIQSTYAQFGGPSAEAHKAIADAMAQYGVGVNQVARASGYTPREVEAEFMGQRAGERPVLDDPTGTAAGMSAAYRAAAQAGGQQTVDDYYENLRKDAASYLANPNAPTGVDAYNLLVESGISTSDLRAAGVADEVLNKIFTVSGPIEQSQFVTPAGMTSAYERSPDLAFESQRLTALGQDGRGILDTQGRDYVANLQKDGIDAAERAQMLEYATERGYSFDDLLKAGVDPNVLFKDDGSAAAAKAAADAAAKAAADKAAADAAAKAAADKAAADAAAEAAAAEAERKRLADIAAAEAAELERQRLAREAADRDVVAGGVTVGDMVTAVTPTYNATQLQNIIKAAENQPAAAGTVTNPIDTKGSAATGSQSGVSKFLETYNPATPFVAPTYTAPTVYQPQPSQPDMFAAGQPALDTAFRESSPRTAIPGMPGQFDYSPAAKLRPATGSGFTFTPPSITTRPRSLLSPTEIQGYGGTMSKSQIFAQNRALIDRNLRDMIGATPALRNASTYNLLRNRVMAGEFGADPARVFNPETAEGQKFQAFLASLAGTAPAQAAATGATTGTVADSVIDIDPTDRQIAAGAGTTSGSTVAGGYAAPIDASPLAYGGYRLEPFKDGGEATSSRRMLESLFGKKSDGSAKDELARFAEGGAVSARRPRSPNDPLYIQEDTPPPVEEQVPLDELLRRQLEAIDNAPSARTAEPEIEQTESRSMLDRVKDAGRFLNQGFYENISKPAVGTAIDMTAGLGDLAQMGARYLGNRAGFDAGEFTSVAQPIKEALGVEDYNPYTVGGLGASILPFATAGRAAAATTRALPGAMLSPIGSPSAARQLSSMFPNLGRETGAYLAAETGAAAAGKLAPDSALAELAGAALGSTGANIAMGSPSMSRIDAPTGDEPPAGSAAEMLDEIVGPDLAVDNPDAKGHALPSLLLVEGTGAEATNPVTQQFTLQNKAQNFQNIDLAESQNPSALMSRDNWLKAEEQAFGGDYLPAPPETAIRYAQKPAKLAATLDRLSPDMKKSVDEGFSYVSEIKNLYNSKIAPPAMTGRLFVWGILSRGVGPAPQEGAFLDLLNNAGPFIDKAVKGQFTEADIDAWKQMVSRSLPEGSPGKSSTMNSNAAGNLLYQLGRSTDGNPSPLNKLHEILSDPLRTGREFRREFFNLTQSPGIDNKVVSFIGLVAGKPDMLVMDRIQSRNLWDDGRYGGKNIYDGINKGGLSGILGGPRGVMVTEMMEDGLSDSVQKAYTMVGRPEDASISRMHWETWLIGSSQPVSHSTLQAVRSGEAIGQSVTEGKRNTFSSGMTYRQAINGPIVEYPLSDGSIVRMTPTRQKEFEEFIKNPKNGIVPKSPKFFVSESKDKPWFEQAGVDRRKLDEAARQFENANPDGSLRSGDARDIEGGSSVSERRAEFLNNFRADQQRIYTARRNAIGDSIGSGGEAPGPYRRGSVDGDGGNGFLVFNPDPSALTSYQSAGMSLPAIRQVDAAVDAAAYNADMNAAMSGHIFSAQVEIKSPEDLAQSRLFRTNNGSGFAIKPDGDVVAVFASPNETKGASYAMLQAAVQAGGRKLDAFDTYLPDIYERVGFRPVARLPWNDDYAPPGWNKETFAKYNNGEPDVVFFVHDPEYFGGAKDVPVVSEYDQAVAFQDQALRQLTAKPQGFKAGGAVTSSRRMLDNLSVKSK